MMRERGGRKMREHRGRRRDGEMEGGREQERAWSCWAGHQ